MTEEVRKLVESVSKEINAALFKAAEVASQDAAETDPADTQEMTVKLLKAMIGQLVVRVAELTGDPNERMVIRVKPREKTVGDA